MHPINAASWMWAKSQWRTRWGTLVLSGLVLALAGSATLAAAMGAHRAPGAFDRLRQRTNAADVRVDISTDKLPDDPKYSDTDVLVGMLAPALGVHGVSRQHEFFLRPKGADLIPNFDIYPIVEEPLMLPDGLSAPINRAVAVSGRLPDPDRANEVALSRGLARRLGVGVGDHVVFESASMDWVETAYSGAPEQPSDGPELDMRVTGLALSPLDFTAPVGVIHLTPAFANTYQERIADFSSVEVRLSDPAATLAKVGRGIVHTGDATLDGAIDINSSRSGRNDQATDGLRVIGRGLWVFAAIAAVAGLVTFGQVTRRSHRAQRGALDTIGALGLGRPARFLAATVALAPAVVIGVVGTAVGSYLVSPFTQVGPAKALDPDPGWFLDPGVFGLGLVAVAVLGVGVVAVGSLGVVRPSRVLEPVVSRHLSIRQPLGPVLGIRHAGAGRKSGASGPNRSTALITMLAVTGTCASLAFGASLRGMVDHPRSWGAPWDAWVDIGERSGQESDDAYERALRELANDDRIASLTGEMIFYPQNAGHDVSVIALDSRRGSASMTVLHGRTPSGPGEIGLGRTTMRRLGLGIGDALTLRLDAEETFEVVGVLAFPFGDFPLDDGMAMTMDGARRLSPTLAGNRIYSILANWAPDVDAGRAGGDLTQAGYRVLSDPRRPPQVTNLAQVDQIPVALAALLGVLGLGALWHGLIVSTRLRRHDFAVMRALGMRTGQLRSAVRWQASAVGVAALVVGVPGGVIAGRLVWRQVAQSTGVAVTHEMAWRSLAVVTVVALVGALVLSWIPGRRATSASPASALTSE